MGLLYITQAHVVASKRTILPLVFFGWVSQAGLSIRQEERASLLQGERAEGQANFQLCRQPCLPASVVQQQQDQVKLTLILRARLSYLRPPDDSVRRGVDTHSSLVVATHTLHSPHNAIGAARTHSQPIIARWLQQQRPQQCTRHPVALARRDVGAGERQQAADGVAAAGAAGGQQHGAGLQGAGLQGEAEAGRRL